MNKFLRTAASALLSFSFAAVSAFASFADSANGISVSETELTPGTEFTVSITVPPAENCDTASIWITYDDSVFEGIEWEPVMSGSVSNIGNGAIAVSAANVERAIILTDGLTLTAKMRVRDDAVNGNYEFRLAEGYCYFCYVDDTGYDFVDVWFPDATAATVTVTGGAEAPAVTAETIIDESDISEEEETTEAGSTSTGNPGMIAVENESDNTAVIIIAVVAVVALIAVVMLVLRGKKK